MKQLNRRRNEELIRCIFELTWKFSNIFCFFHLNQILQKAKNISNSEDKISKDFLCKTYKIEIGIKTTEYR